MRETNRHPADALHDIRAQLKALAEEEAALRAYLLEHPNDRVGAEHVAAVADWQQQRVDKSALVRELGPAAARFLRRMSVKVVRLKPRNCTTTDVQKGSAL